MSGSASLAHRSRLAGLFVTLVLGAWFHDLALLGLEESPGPLAAFSLLLPSLIIGGVFTAAGALLHRISRLPGFAERPLARALLFGLPPGILLAVLSWQLFEGAWIREQSWRDGVRIPIVLIVPAGAVWLAHVIRCAAFSTPRWRRGLAAALLFVLASSPILDRLLLPGLYPALHTALRFVFLLALLALGRVVDFRAPPRWLIPASLFTLTALGLLQMRVLPGKDPEVTSILMERAPLASTILPVLFPAEGEENGDVSREMLRFLGPRPPLPAVLLDERFPGRRRWNLVLITIDTLRWDHVSCYGYHRATTPHMDGLAREGVLFENAYAPFPASSLSMASLFTGVYPTATGFRRRQRDPGSGISDDPSFTERFRAAGFRTAAVLGLPRVRENPDFSYLPRGFEVFNEELPATGVDGKRVVAAARRFLDTLDEGERFFLWLHFFEPHSPYVAHEGFSFGDTILDRYDSEVAWTDARVGEFLAEVERRGLEERTVILVHADHGEEFKDHGGVFHGATLYDEVMRVPLLMRIPGTMARRIDHPVELVDLAPTFTDLFGLEALPSSQGQSLLPLLLDDPPPECVPPPVAFMQMRLGSFRGLDAVRSGRWKLIRNLRSGVEHLFDLQADPHEKRDLIARKTGRAARLRGQLAAFHLLLEERGGRAGADLLQESPEDPQALLSRLKGAADPAARHGAALGLLDLGRPDLLGGTALHILRKADTGSRRLQALRLLLMARFAPAVPEVRRLLDDPDPGLAAEAALFLGVMRDEKSAARIQALGVRAPAFRGLCALALGFLGRKEACSRLREAWLSPASGPLRPHLALALLTAGELDFRESVLGLVQQDLDDPLLEDLALHVAGRSADMDVLQALHARLLLEALSPRTVLAILAIARSRGDPLLALPFLSLGVASPNAVVRKRAATLLADLGLAASERDLRRMQAMAASAWGLPPDLASEAARIVLAAFEWGVARGLPDWGLLAQVWSYLVLARDLDRAARLTDVLRGRAASLPPACHDLMRRLSVLAGALRSPPRLRLKLLDDLAEPLAPNQVTWLRLTLSAEPSGGALLGGPAPIAPRIVLSLHREGRPETREHETNVILPSHGLLPGESFTLIVPCDTRGLEKGVHVLELSAGGRFRPIGGSVITQRVTIP